MACVVRYKKTRSPLADSLQSAEEELKAQENDVRSRKWKKQTPLGTQFLRGQVLNKRLNNAVRIDFHAIVGSRSSPLFSVKRRIIAMKRLSEYVHIDFQNELGIPIELVITCQSFDGGEQKVFCGVDIIRWEGYCNVYGENVPKKYGFLKKLKVELMYGRTGLGKPTIEFTSVSIENKNKK